MQVYETKGFARFARQERIADGSLRAAIFRAEQGLIDADLGGGLINSGLRVKARGALAGIA